MQFVTLKNRILQNFSTAKILIFEGYLKFKLKKPILQN